MPEENLSRNTQQEMLKDVFAGRDCNIGNLKQQSIQNQLNIILNIPSFSNPVELKEAISKAY